MKNKQIYIVVLLSLSLNTLVGQRNNSLVNTPPMGWNSYNCFGAAVHEDEVLANSNYMAANLKKYGWEYIVIDYCWSYNNAPGSRIGNPPQFILDDGSYVPWLTMDFFGRLLPDQIKFPSASGSKGFKMLADSIHAKGLKFGIHINRGIPRQAVWAKSPVFETNSITADMVADTSSVCGWLNHMYGLDMNKKGAQEYLNSLLKLYAEWDIDFIKIDDLSSPYSDSEIEGYRKAISNCGRPIVFSLSPGPTPVEKSLHVKTQANMWRIANDFWDSWDELLKMFNYAKKWEGKGSDSSWPDCDMMQIGKISKRGPEGNERYSRFTEDELFSHFTFWSIYKSPLILGGNLPENRKIENQLITNVEVINVNKFGQHPRQLYKNESTMIWVSDAIDSKAMYVALFNIGDTVTKINLKLSDLKLRRCLVRDLWKKKDVGIFKKELSINLNPHGTAIFKLSSK